MSSKVKNIQKNLKSSAVLVSKTEKIIYLTEFNGFSKDEREGFLFITRKKKYVITDGRYSNAAGKLLPDFIFYGLTKDKSFVDNLKEIAAKEKLKKILIDEKDLSAKEYTSIKKVFKNISDEKIIDKLREVKDESEIKNIKKACLIGDLVFKQILKSIKTGVTEIEIAKRIEILILSKNAACSFRPIVAFGSNSSSPHHVPNNKKIKNNSILLLDFGVRYNNYCSDITRTIFFGKSTEEFKKIYKTVLKSQQIVIQQLNNLVIHHGQIKASDIDKLSRSYIISQGYPGIPHSLGHGIGLEVHESPGLSPKSKDILKKGMVFSIEPGIYLEELGGVRIEDLFLLTARGAKQLTHAQK